MADLSNLPKRQLILQAAADVFATKGYYGAKIEDIAQQAEIGKGTVYEYFKSKKELFNELIREGFRCLETMVVEEISQAQTVRKKLEGILCMKLIFSTRYQKLARIVMLENIPFDDAFRVWMQEVHHNHLRHIEELVREGIDKQEIAKIDPGLFAKVYIGGTAFIGNPLICNNISEEECAEIAEKTIGLYFEGIGMI